MKFANVHRASITGRFALRLALFSFVCLSVFALSSPRFGVAPAAGAATIATQEKQINRKAGAIRKEGATRTEATSQQSAKAGGKSGSAALGVRPLVVCTQNQPIAFGQSRDGTIASGDCVNPVDSDGTLVDEYTFNGTAGQRILITMVATAQPTPPRETFDPYLYLLGPDNSVIAENDDIDGNANNFDARIPNGTPFLTLVATGTYSILASTFAAEHRGNYRITLTEASSRCATPSINFGQSLTGALATSDCTNPFTLPNGAYDNTLVDLYTFSGTVGQQISIEMSSAIFNTFLYLVAPNGEVLEANDDGGGGTNSRIPQSTGFVRLSTNGTYIIVANSFAANQTGAYSIRLNSGGLCPSTPISPGQTINGALGSGDCLLIEDNSFLDTYTFSGTQGQPVAISMSATSGNLNPFLFLLAPNGSILAQNNDGGGGTSARIPAGTATFALPTNGTYTILANSFEPNQTGNYTLTLSGVSLPGTTLRFSAATFTVSENDPTKVATITVERVGDVSGATTVEYATVDDPAAVPCDPTIRDGNGNLFPQGKAYARCDYATTIDTLTFPAGDTQPKSFTIPLVNDVHVEGNETFQLALRNPQGAALGTQATATVTLVDDDAAPSSTNPVNQTPFFVRQQYLDFLSREPEAGEPWSNVLNRCSDVNNNPACDRITVSFSFFGSPEFRLKGFFVFLHYKASFGSAKNPNYVPQYDEFVPDMRRVTGQTPDEVFAKRLAFTTDWVNRPAFTRLYPTSTPNSAFIDALLSNVGITLTTPDPTSGATRNSLIENLNAGTKTRAEVLRLIVESEQASIVQFNRAFVAIQYYGYLRRTPEPVGYQSWLNVIGDPNVDAQTRNRTMINGFLNSAEYRLRFGPNSLQ